MNSTIKNDYITKKQLEMYQIYLSKNPNDINALNNCGQALCSLGRHREGIGLFNRALKLDPSDDMVIANKGAAYSDLHEYENAIKCYEIALTFNKNSVLAHYNKGNAYVALGDSKRAIACYDIVIAFDPKNQDAINNRACALLELGQFEEGIKKFEKLSPEHESAQFFFNAKGAAYFENNQLDDAIACFDECLSIGDDTNEYREALLQKATIYARMKRYKEANDMLEKLMNMKNLNDEMLAHASHVRGNAYFSFKKYEQAVESYKKAIELNLAIPVVYENCGISLQKLNK